MVLSAGQRIGHYEIVSAIGAGGMGEVYRAHDATLKRDVALKILPASVSDDLERLTRFEREARVLAALNHPHIAAIYGVEETDGVRALVLELVEGPTLAEQLRRGPLSVRKALSTARQIADALDAAHDKGIVHRDLKPANITVTPDGIVKVLDFGIAKMRVLDEATADASTVTTVGTRAGTVLGTAAYMSPEQARGQMVDKRTDIWAFGCVLYEMLTGHRAFAGETVSDTLARVLEREPALDMLPPATPPHVHRLLHRCLEKDPKQRLRDIGDARVDLDEQSSVAPRAAPRRVVGLPSRDRAFGRCGCGRYGRCRRGHWMDPEAGCHSRPHTVLAPARRRHAVWWCVQVARGHCARRIIACVHRERATVSPRFRRAGRCSDSRD
jgi:eukaryotic-like serine/threonine-protein kinase